MDNRGTSSVGFDVVVIVGVVSVIAYLTYRVVGVLHYKWNWAEIPQYFFRYDAEEGRWVANLLVQGFLTTVRLAIWATVLAFVIRPCHGFLPGQPHPVPAVGCALLR